MTTITASIADSTGTPINGFIVVNLDSVATNVSTNQVFVPTATTVTLVNGTATFWLAASGASTYSFEVYRSGGGGQPNVLVYTFRAPVPESATPIPLLQLVPIQQAITSNVSATLSSITKSLTLSEEFWTKFKDSFIRAEGNYNPSIAYVKGSLVLDNGGSYLYIGSSSLVGIPTTNASFWQPVAYPGSAGSQGPVGPQGPAGTGGNGGSGVPANDAAYSASGWDGQTDAPTRNAVRDVIETLATKTALANTDTSVASLSSSVTNNTNAIATNATAISNNSSALLTKANKANDTLTGASFSEPVLSSAIPSLTDSSTKIPSTSWVQQVVQLVKNTVAAIPITPVGSILTWSGTTAPTGWLLCDGGTYLKSAYPSLFAVVGASYGTPTDPATQFKVPDMRGRVPMGLDDMATSTGVAGRVVTASGSILGGSGGIERIPNTSQLSAHSHPIKTLATMLSTVAHGTSGATEVAVSTGDVNTNNIVQSTGGPNTGNNLSPFLSVNFIIYAGI